MMYSKGKRQKVELKEKTLDILHRAQSEGDHTREQICYGVLSQIAEAEGEKDTAAKYMRWHDEIEASQWNPKLEKWQSDVDITKMLIDSCEQREDMTRAAAFRKQLRELGRSKPEQD